MMATDVGMATNLTPNFTDPSDTVTAVTSFSLDRQGISPPISAPPTSYRSPRYSRWKLRQNRDTGMSPACQPAPGVGSPRPPSEPRSSWPHSHDGALPDGRPSEALEVELEKQNLEYVTQSNYVSKLPMQPEELHETLTDAAPSPHSPASDGAGSSQPRDLPLQVERLEEQLEQSAQREAQLTARIGDLETLIGRERRTPDGEAERGPEAGFDGEGSGSGVLGSKERSAAFPRGDEAANADIAASGSADDDDEGDGGQKEAGEEGRADGAGSGGDVNGSKEGSAVGLRGDEATITDVDASGGADDDDGGAEEEEAGDEGRVGEEGSGDAGTATEGRGVGFMAADEAETGVGATDGGDGVADDEQEKEEGEKDAAGKEQKEKVVEKEEAAGEGGSGRGPPPQDEMSSDACGAPPSREGYVGRSMATSLPPGRGLPPLENPPRAALQERGTWPLAAQNEPSPLSDSPPLTRRSLPSLGALYATFRLPPASPEVHVTLATLHRAHTLLLEFAAVLHSYLPQNTTLLSADPKKVEQWEWSGASGIAATSVLILLRRHKTALRRRLFGCPASFNTPEPARALGPQLTGPLPPLGIRTTTSQSSPRPSRTLRPYSATAVHTLTSSDFAPLAQLSTALSLASIDAAEALSVEEVRFEEAMDHLRTAHEMLILQAEALLSFAPRGCHWPDIDPCRWRASSHNPINPAAVLRLLRSHQTRLHTQMAAPSTRQGQQGGLPAAMLAPQCAPDESEPGEVTDAAPPDTGVATVTQASSAVIGCGYKAEEGGKGQVTEGGGDAEGRDAGEERIGESQKDADGAEGGEVTEQLALSGREGEGGEVRGKEAGDDSAAPRLPPPADTGEEIAGEEEGEPASDSAKKAEKSTREGDVGAGEGEGDSGEQDGGSDRAGVDAEGSRSVTRAGDSDEMGIPIAGGAVTAETERPSVNGEGASGSQLPRSGPEGAASSIVLPSGSEEGGGPAGESEAAVLDAVEPHKLSEGGSEAAAHSDGDVGSGIVGEEVRPEADGGEEKEAAVASAEEEGTESLERRHSPPPAAGGGAEESVKERGELAEGGGEGEDHELRDANEEGQMVEGGVSVVEGELISREHFEEEDVDDDERDGLAEGHGRRHANEEQMAEKGGTGAVEDELIPREHLEEEREEEEDGAAVEEIVQGGQVVGSSAASDAGDTSEKEGDEEDASSAVAAVERADADDSSQRGVVGESAEIDADPETTAAASFEGSQGEEWVDGEGPSQGEMPDAADGEEVLLLTEANDDLEGTSERGAGGNGAPPVASSLSRDGSAAESKGGGEGEDTRDGDEGTKKELRPAERPSSTAALSGRWRAEDGSSVSSASSSLSAESSLELSDEEGEGQRARGFGGEGEGGGRVEASEGSVEGEVSFREDAS